MHRHLSPTPALVLRTLAVLAALACTASVVTFSARAMQGPREARVVASAKVSAVLADVSSVKTGAPAPGLRAVNVPALRLPRPKPAPRPVAPAAPAAPLTTLVRAPAPVAPAPAPAPVAAPAPAPAPRPAAPAPAPARGPSFDSSG
jgi:hypothetical protein